MELAIANPIISSSHARIIEQEGSLYLEDMDSRNGTFVNGDRILQPTRIYDGDVIQFSHCVFRLRRESISDDRSFCATLNARGMDQAMRIIEFEDLMSNQLIDPHFQSIVRLEDGQTVGFESLARGIPYNLHSPGELFRAAEKMQREGDLSEMLRRVAAAAFEIYNHEFNSNSTKLFLNTHPCEMEDSQALIESLDVLRNKHPDVQLVLEIHESSVTDIDEMRRLGKEVKDLGVELAYDDFGAGQARFFELIEEPPSYLKFDIRLVKDLHKASIRRVQAIEQLVIMVKNLGITCIAEGIEVEEDAVICRELGFSLAQGYYFSQPEPISHWVDSHVKSR